MSALQTVLLDRLYVEMERLGEQACDDNRTQFLQGFGSLCQLFANWLFGSDVRRLESEEEVMKKQAGFSHSAVLPLFLLSLRESECSSLASFLAFFGSWLTTHPQPLPFVQPVVKELLLLHRDGSEDAQSLILHIMNTLLCHQLESDSFGCDLDAVCSFVLALFSEAERHRLLSALFSSLFHSVLATSVWSPVRMSSVACLAQCAEEVGVTTQCRLDRYCELINQARMRDAPSQPSGELKDSDAASETEPSNPERVFHHYFDELYRGVLVESVDVVDMIPPLVDRIRLLQSRALNTTCLKPLLLLLTRKLYALVTSDRDEASTDAAQIRLFDAIRSLLSTAASTPVSLAVLLVLLTCVADAPSHTALLDDKITRLTDSIASEDPNAPLPQVVTVNRRHEQDSRIPPDLYSAFNHFVLALAKQRSLFSSIEGWLVRDRFIRLDANDTEDTQVAQAVGRAGDESKALTEAKHRSVLETREQLNHAINKRLLGWRDLAENVLQNTELSSPFFHDRCSYYVTSPHMGPGGVRTKLVKIKAPSRAYEQAREKRTEKESRKEEDSLYSSLQRASSSRCVPLLSSSRRVGGLHSRSASTPQIIIHEWQARQISPYGVFEGTFSLTAGCLLFLRHSSHQQSDSTLLHSMRCVHLTQVRLGSVIGLFKRTYECQQSSFEVFYKKNGFTNSVFLTFATQVREAASNEA